METEIQRQGFNQVSPRDQRSAPIGNIRVGRVAPPQSTELAG